MSDEEDKKFRQELSDRYNDELVMSAWTAVGKGFGHDQFIVYCMQLLDPYWQEHAPLIMDEKDIADSLAATANPIAIGFLPKEVLAEFIAVAPSMRILLEKPNPGYVTACVFAASGAKVYEIFVGARGGYGTQKTFNA